jgi:hypothetical protein
MLRQEFGEVYDELLALLFRHDPANINYGHNTDEYDPELRPILLRLGECSTVDQLVQLTHEVFVELFSAETAGTIDRYQPIGAEIWELTAAWRAGR